jgi:hypothetical protein
VAWRQHILSALTESRLLRTYHDDIIVTALVNRSIMKGGPTQRGAVCITSYGMVSANPDLFSDEAGRKQWDYVILDEGHKVLILYY